MGESPFINGKYVYMEDLCCMASRVPPARHVPSQAGVEVTSPLVISEWSKLLASHPDIDYVGFLLSGTQYGFRIGFDYTKFSCTARHNIINGICAKEP